MTTRPNTTKRKKKRAPEIEPSKSAILAKKLFILFIFMLAQLLFYYSDFFKLKDIRIHGNRKISNEQIIQTANIPLDHNIITLPLQTFQERLASIHWIKDVDIKWSVPGRVEIFVNERSPVILVRQNGKPGQWFAADEFGMILYLAEEPEKTAFPRMLMDNPISIGEHLPEEPIQAVKIIHPSVPENVRKSMKYYIVEETGEVVIISSRMGKPFKIKFGEPENIERKIELLEAIMDLIDEKKTPVQYVDLRFNTPTIMPIIEEKETDKNNKEKTGESLEKTGD